MQRLLFGDSHELFRANVRRFIAAEVAPHRERWREAGVVDRDAWRRAGAAGLLCPWLAPEYGGAGGDFLHSVVVIEELARVYETGFALALHSDVVARYIESFGTPEQKRRFLPGCASGELVTAIAMTEPHAGSDLGALTTKAERRGDHYTLSGAKTFVSNGTSCDLCIVAAKTSFDPKRAHASLSLFLVEATRQGFVRGKRLKKMGLHSQDTSELILQDCIVPVENRLGEEGDGFAMMTQKLQQERLVVAIAAQATAEQVLVDTMAYCEDRRAFGRPISRLQNTQFKLAECATELAVGRAFLDRVIAEHALGAPLLKEAAMAKLWQTEMLGRVTDTCLQLFGGAGYMLEYPLAGAYIDARVTRIYAGTNEIMKMVIAQELGL